MSNKKRLHGFEFFDFLFVWAKCAKQSGFLRIYLLEVAFFYVTSLHTLTEKHTHTQFVILDTDYSVFNVWR